jgi:hypothetical protein
LLALIIVSKHDYRLFSIVFMGGGKKGKGGDKKDGDKKGGDKKGKKDKKDKK